MVNNDSNSRYLQGKNKLAKMVCSGSLTPGSLAFAPGFVNSDYVTAEITYSTVHVHHGVPGWTWAASVMWTPPKIVAALLLCHTCVHWVSHGGENTACLLLQLLSQPPENTVMAAVSVGRVCVRLCYGCCHGHCISQERLNVSAVPKVFSSFPTHTLSTLSSANSARRRSILVRLWV